MAAVVPSRPLAGPGLAGHRGADGAGVKLGSSPAIPGDDAAIRPVRLAEEVELLRGGRGDVPRQAEPPAHREIPVGQTSIRRSWNMRKISADHFAMPLTVDRRATISSSLSRASRRESSTTVPSRTLVARSWRAAALRADRPA